MILKEDDGQISLEFIFIVSFTIILTIITLNFIAEESELNIAISSGKSGIIEGSLIDSSGIYPKSAYDDYIIDKKNLLKPNHIEINTIAIKSSEFDSKYNKTKIQLQVYASCENIKDKKEQDSLGDRINYNLRKSIANTFNTTNLTNSLYNPVFSKNYIFTTANVVWV